MKRLALVLFFIFFSVFVFADGYMFLEVDGLRIHIDDIIFGENYSDSTTTASITLDQNVDLTANPNDVFSGGIELRLSFGYSELEYDHININLSGGVEIKGHAYDVDSGSHIYTSESGIAEVDTGSSTWAAPSDYDYLGNDFFYANEDGGSAVETTHMVEAQVYSVESTLDIYLLVDIYKVAYYWDGSDEARVSFVDTWHQENSDNFPTGIPVVGVTYIPFYVMVNQSAARETYVFASSEADLDGLPETPDESSNLFVTLVFDEDTDEFIVGRTANWDDVYPYYLALPQYVRGAVIDSGTGEYTLTLENYGDNEGWTGEQTVTGFSRLELGQQGQAQVGSDIIYYQRVQ